MSKERKPHVVTGSEMRGKLKRASRNLLSLKTPYERSLEKRKKAKERVRQPKVRRNKVDREGNEVVLTEYQKRHMYRKAMRIKKRIEDAMLSRDQHWNPTERNIDLLSKREHGIGNLKREYSDIMEAIGASDSDLGVEKFRRDKR